MNERLKTHSKTQKKSADLVSNKLRIGVFQRYQMKCKSVSKKSPRYKHLLMSPVQDVSPEILIHRQGTVIGFNQPQYQVQFEQNVTVQGFILCIPVPALAHPGQVSDNHAVTMAIQTEALHFPGAGVNITDRGDLPLKQRITE